jgi:hypothetical protein
MRVETTDGRVLGVVVAPIYEPSARWDLPRALAVRADVGELTVELDAIVEVDLGSGRLVVDGV